MKTVKYKPSFVVSLSLHAIVLLLLLVSFSWSSPPIIVNKGNKIVHAVAVDSTQVDKIVKDLKQQQQAKAAAEDAKQKHLVEQAKAAEKKRVDEQKQLEALKKQQVELQKQKTSEAEALKKLKAEQAQQSKQLEELKEQQKALQEKEKAAKQKAQNDAALALQKQIAEKQAAIAQQKSEAIAGIVNQYQGLIIEAISKNWLVPSGTDPNTACQLYIRLLPDGKVIDVKIMKGSGNIALDRSAVAAVYKASPLPVPKDPAAYQPFKQFNLTVKPEELVEVNG